MSEKILLVDDDADTLKFLKLFVKKLGFEALEAPDGMTALRVAHEQHPDLIILDVMMPGMDGFEVARTLRRHPDTALIPILMFTVRSQVEDKLAGYEAGVDIYLTKPVHPVELQANISALLTKKKARTDALTRRGYVVGVLAAKGGLGASTVALNLAVTFRQKQKKKVIAMETRPGQSTWRDELGLASASGLENLLNLNPNEITTAQVEKQLVSNTFGVPLLLASNDVTQLSNFTNAAIHYEAIVEQLSELTDLLVIDIGVHYHPAYEVFTRLCHEMILITEPQPLTVKRTRSLVADLKTRDFGSAKPLDVVTMNRTRAEMTMSVSQIEEALGHSVTLGIPPAPELAYLSMTRSTPMILAQPEGVIAKQFETLADHLARHIGAVQK